MLDEEFPCEPTAGAADRTALGSFDIRTLTGGITHLREQEERAVQDLIELQKRYGVPPPPEILLAHQLRHDLYYRVRAHEKAHHYQFISTATALARTFSENDTDMFLDQALGDLLPPSPVWLPLIRWAGSPTGDCPPKLQFVVERSIWAERAYAAIDGLSGPDVPDQDTRSALFPGSSAQLTEEPRYRMGFRYLTEGSAKAAEWLYLLREAPDRASIAEADILESPEEYRRAYRFLAHTLPEASVSSRLQTLVVAADIALHPELPPEAWPDLYEAATAQMADLLPGPRFVRVVELISRAPSSLLASKEALGAYLVGAATETFGWSPPAAATSRVLGYLRETMDAPSNRETLDLLPGTSHPLRMIEAAQKVRLADLFAYVPPVNSALINPSGTVPRGFQGSKYDPISEVQGIIGPPAWFGHRLARQLVHARCPSCPIRQEQSYIAEFTEEGLCRELAAGRCLAVRSQGAVRDAFLHCGYVARALRRPLGDAWASRLRFYVAATDESVPP